MTDRKRDWQTLLEEVEEAMKDWRKSHPRATFTEIETSVDEEVARARWDLNPKLSAAQPLTDVNLKKPESPLQSHSSRKESFGYQRF